MTIQIINGDLLEASENILGHQVNCQGVMGSGIAKILRDRYPNLFPEYKKYCDQYTPDELLGHCQLVQTGAKYTANLFGQLDYGRSKTRYTDYAALEQALTILRTEAQAKGLSVALPCNIGCGLANGEWSVVEQMIGRFLQTMKLLCIKYRQLYKAHQARLLTSRLALFCAPYTGHLVVMRVADFLLGGVNPVAQLNEE